jgi:hypothetical protein
MINEPCQNALAARRAGHRFGMMICHVVHLLKIVSVSIQNYIAQHNRELHQLTVRIQPILYLLSVSGNSALFFAMMGYKNHPHHQDIYINIIKQLIDNNANIIIQNRENLIFPHQAIKFLEPNQLKFILNHIDNQRMKIKDLFNIVNNYNEGQTCNVRHQQ